MEDKRILVIIPVFNCKQYLNNAVQSVLNQPYKNVSIILIDDGSTDGSSELCDEIGRDNSSICVIHQENKGVSSARNTGIHFAINNSNTRAKNTYIAFLDADDMWQLGCLDEKIENILNNGYDLIGFQSVDCDQNINYRREPLKLEEGVVKGGIDSVWRYSTQSFAAMLYNLEFLKKYQLEFYSLKYSEDKIFSMQCMYLANEIYLENRLFYLYRINHFSAMHNRQTGLNYYIPIINGYLQLDKDIEKMGNDTQEQLKVGTVLAKIYLLEMIDEHFQYGGGVREIEAFFENNLLYRKLLEDDSLGEKRISERWSTMKKYPLKMILKNRVIGMMKRLSKCILKISIVRVCINKMKYPIKINNNEGVV